MIRYKLLVCGGTFDLLHKGHKAFLKKVFESSDKVLLGITSNLYTQSFKRNSQIEDFEIRKQAVEHFLDSISVSERVQITAIDNAYEPYLEISLDYQAIAVTPQTEQAAIEINIKRKQNGVPKLEIVVIPMKQAQDGELISSTRIRNGEINREGRLYVNPLWKNKKLVLPEAIRTILHEPFGKILNSVPHSLDGSKTVAIGDVTTQKFNKQKVSQFLSIIDFLVQREILFHEIRELGFNGEENIKKIKNPPGTITPELFEAVGEAFDVENTKRKVILIGGEEDLAVLPVLLIAPLGYSVFYGQPNEGLVRVAVTEENKEKAYELAEKFVSKKELS